MNYKYFSPIHDQFRDIEFPEGYAIKFYGVVGEHDLIFNPSQEKFLSKEELGYSLAGDNIRHYACVLTLIPN